MKKQDIAVLIAVAFFAGVFSLVISSIFIKPSSKQLTAETVEPITTEFPAPDKSIFNSEAINPTKLIKIGDSNNPRPF